MIIKPYTVDDGTDGVYLVDGLLTVRLGGGCLEYKVPIDQAFIHTGDELPYENHELDVHVDAKAIRATIKRHVEEANDSWTEHLKDFIEYEAEPSL